MGEHLSTFTRAMVPTGSRKKQSDRGLGGRVLEERRGVKDTIVQPHLKRAEYLMASSAPPMTICLLSLISGELLIEETEKHLLFSCKQKF